MKLAGLKTTFRLLLFALFIIGVFLIIDWALAERDLINLENRGVQLIEQGEWLAAAEIFEGILENESEIAAPRRDRVRRRLAQCYFEYSYSSYHLSLEETLSYCKKAYALDPSAISDPALLRLVERRLQEL